MTPIHFLKSLIQLIDNSKLRDGITDILQDYLLIPKPKFKVGDVVKVIYGEKTKWEIEGRYYSHIDRRCVPTPVREHSNT